jgi:hypothetical protein
VLSILLHECFLITLQNKGNITRTMYDCRMLCPSHRPILLRY